MKNLILSLITVCLFTLNLQAQFNVQIEESVKPMSKGEKTALTVHVKKGNEKEIKKAWTKTMKDFKGGKTKRNKKTKEIFSDNIVIKELSDNTVDVYSTFQKSGEDIIVSAWFDLGGAYLNSTDHAEAYPHGEKIMKDFALSVSKSMVEDVLKGEEKTLKKLNGDVKDLAKNKSDLESDIEKFKKKIAEAEKKIEQNIKDQAAKETEVDEQKKVVESVKDRLKKMK